MKQKQQQQQQQQKRFWKYIKNKGKVTLESFRNFAYVSSYLHLKIFAWKGDYVYLKNYKCHRLNQGHSEKLLQS